MPIKHGISIQNALLIIKLSNCLRVKGDKSPWLITTAGIVLSGQNTTIIPNHFWDGYGDGMPDGVPDERRI
jgi:hypothetical protein